MQVTADHQLPASTQRRRIDPCRSTPLNTGEDKISHRTYMQFISRLNPGINWCLLLIKLFVLIQFQIVASPCMAKPCQICSGKMLNNWHENFCGQQTTFVGFNSNRFVGWAATIFLNSEYTCYHTTIDLKLVNMQIMPVFTI